MMEKRNVAEPKRTPCEICGKPSAMIRSDGVAVCTTHFKVSAEKRAFQNKVEKEELTK